MPSSLTHKYIPRIEQNEENLFMEEYFSSTDTKIFMDNEEQTEISYIQYSIQEQLKPIYGYSSRTWDDVAVGNRIVMGTFRVPIKNNERQSTMEEITKKANKSFSIDYSDTINDYNEKENSDLNSIDWYQGPMDDATPNTNPDNIVEESDIDFEYRTKLINLGYDLDYNGDSNSLMEAIKAFQKANELDVTGTLNAQTENAINRQVENSLKKTRTLPPNTKLYTGPAQNFYYTVTKTETVVYVLDESYDDNWSYVMTSDGKEVFINV